VGPGTTGAELSDIDVWIPIAAANGLRFAKGADWATTRNSQWVSIIARPQPEQRPNAPRRRRRQYQAGQARYGGAQPRDLTSLDSQFVELNSIVGEIDALCGSAEMRFGSAGLVHRAAHACANVVNLLLV
jgi:hypothetical protein